MRADEKFPVDLRLRREGDWLVAYTTVDGVHDAGNVLGTASIRAMDLAGGPGSPAHETFVDAMWLLYAAIVKDITGQEPDQRTATFSRPTQE